MKYLPILFLFAITAAVTSACKSRPVTDRSDYAAYLQPSSSHLEKIDSDLAFWRKRLEEDPGHLGAQSKTASLLTKRFQYSGNINDLLKADSLYQKINRIQKLFTSSVYRNLAANAVTQHRFMESRLFLDSAAKLGDNLAYTLLQQSDVQLELGNSAQAKRLLLRYPQQNAFEVLIRRAKITDHEGDLEKAIEWMEQALEKVNPQNDEASYTWAKSNLADFYSHAGRLTDAYEAYLTVLKLDPENYHCLKGIAWLAFSADHKTAEAKEILHFLQQQHPVPDYDLLLSQVAEFENDSQLANQYQDRFLAAAAAPSYGNMYNKYLFSIYADERNEWEKAKALAETEVKNRPTPESYGLLSWALYKSGKYSEALQLVQKHVENKGFEPHTAYYLARIYEATGNSEKRDEYLKEVELALFELGPSYQNKLKRGL